MATNVFAEDCVKCGPKDVAGMPKNSMFNNLEKIVTNKKIVEDDRFMEILDFCLKFEITHKNLTSSLLAEMRATKVTIEDFLTAPICQPSLYSDVVRMPMLHLIADDITMREEMLTNIWLYYSKKVKQPEEFDRIVKAKNTKGETFLDYLESMRLDNRYRFDTQKVALKNIIKILCDHGVVYETKKNMKCP